MRRAVRGRDIKPGTVTSTLWLRWPCDELGNALRDAAAPCRGLLQVEARPPEPPGRLSRRPAMDPLPHARRARCSPCRLARPCPATRGGRAHWVRLRVRSDEYLLCAQCRRRPTARVIAALLNSTWIRALATMRAPARGGWFPAVQCARHRGRCLFRLAPSRTRHSRGRPPTAPSDDSALAVDDRVAILLELSRRGAQCPLRDRRPASLLRRLSRSSTPGPPRCGPVPSRRYRRLHGRSPSVSFLRRQTLTPHVAPPTAITSVPPRDPCDGPARRRAARPARGKRQDLDGTCGREALQWLRHDDGPRTGDAPLALASHREGSRCSRRDHVARPAQPSDRSRLGAAW